MVYTSRFQPGFSGTLGFRQHSPEIPPEVIKMLRSKVYFNSPALCKALDALLQRDGTLTIHKKNLQKLMVEIYKTINHLNPPYMWDLFTKKVVEFDFRIKILCELPPARSQRFGTNSLIFKGSLLWNSLSDDTKTSQSLAIFKQKIRSWDGAHCTCNICRN